MNMLNFIAQRRRRAEVRKLSGLALCPLPKPLPLDEAQRVLVFAPHPDDETLGCGGTLMQLATRCDVRVVLITDGSGAGGLPEGAAHTRQQEFVNALAMLGITDTVSLREPDGAFVAHQAFEHRVKTMLDEFKPNWVFLPSPLDYHRDHVAISHSLTRLCRATTVVKQLIHYEIWAPVPATHTVDITEQWPTKRLAIEQHATALQHGDYLRAIEGLNRYRGLYSGQKNRMAEAFWVESLPNNPRFTHLVQKMALALIKRLNHPNK